MGGIRSLAVSSLRGSRKVTAATPAATTTTTTTTTPPPIVVAPVDSTAPIISGTTQKGQTLSVTTGAWLNSPTSFSYQWLQGTSAISGANGASYVVSTGDIGLNISCAVTASNSAGSATVSAALVGPVTDLAPVNTAAPVVSGPTTVGQTLSATQGNWLNSPVSFAYSWQRNGATIAGATANSYALVSADDSCTITCTVTATNSGGSVPAVSNSVGPIGTVTSGPSAPVLTQTSTAGSAPFTWDETIDATSFAGIRRRLQVASDAGFTTILYDLYKPLLEKEIAGNDAIWGSVSDDPPRDYATDVITYITNLAGSIYMRERLERDDGLNSAWSNVLHDTILGILSLPHLQVWLDPSDLSTMFQSGTRAAPGTAVAADGDPVGLILDKSGNAHDFTASGTTRPLYKTSAGKSWLQFDGVDDAIVADYNATIGVATMVAGMTTPSDFGNFRTAFSDFFGGTIHQAFSRNSGNWTTGSADTLGATGRVWTNKVQTAAITLDTPTVVSFDGTGMADPLAFTSGMKIGAGGGANVHMMLYGLVLAGSSNAQVLSTSDRHTAEDFLATKSGAY